MMQPTFSPGYRHSMVWSIKSMVHSWYDSFETGPSVRRNPARTGEVMASQGFCFAIQTTCKSQVASGNRLRWSGFAPWKDGVAGWIKAQEHELQKRWRRLLLTAPPEELATWGEARRSFPSSKFAVIYTAPDLASVQNCTSFKIWASR